MLSEAHQWQNTIHNCILYFNTLWMLSLSKRIFCPENPSCCDLLNSSTRLPWLQFYTVTYFIHSSYGITIVQLHTVAHSIVAVSLCRSLSKWTLFSITTFEHMAVLYHICMFYTLNCSYIYEPQDSKIWIVLTITKLQVYCNNNYN